MKMATLVFLAMATLACGGGAPATALPPPATPSAVPIADATVVPTASPTATPTSTASPTPEPAPTASPTPAAPDGFKMVTTDLFRIAVPESWDVELDADDETPMKATSPLGGADVAVYYSPDALGENSIQSYAGDSANLLGDLWQTEVVSSETTLGGIPAIKHEALQTFLAIQSHITFYAEYPEESGNVLGMSLDNDGDEPDPAFETIIESFELVE